jgi:glycerol-3-phosphate O-acyltransferase
LRTPVDEISISYSEVVDGVSKLKEKLKEMYEQGEVLISPELRWNVDKIIEHGMKNINMYHTASPLTKPTDTTMGSEDLKLLYYYHNRLEGYGLEKFL